MGAKNQVAAGCRRLHRRPDFRSCDWICSYPVFDWIRRKRMYKIVKASDGYEVKKGMQTICTGLTFEQATRAKSYLENK